MSCEAEQAAFDLAVINHTAAIAATAVAQSNHDVDPTPATLAILNAAIAAEAEALTVKNATYFALMECGSGTGTGGM